MMASTSTISVVLIFLAHISQSQQYTCPTYTTPLPGPPKPLFPDSYSTVIEANLLEQNKSLTAEEYFDNDGNRATLKMRQDNVVTTLVFDYKNDELFYVRNGGCKVTNLSQDNNYVFFGKPSKTGPAHVFSSKQALEFTGDEVYMGQATVRGIICDHWQSCRYWPDLDSNFTQDYYLTALNWQDPIASPQIPVRLIISGVRNDGGNVFNFTHFYDYVNFQPLVTDPTVFETPKGVICPRRKVTKPVPTLPPFYHYRQEIIVSGDTDIFLADVWYDHELRLVRFDYRLKNQIAPLFTLNPITEIHDYNYGGNHKDTTATVASTVTTLRPDFTSQLELRLTRLRYVKDQVKGDCVAASLSNSSFDVAQNTTVYVNGNKSYAVHMKDPMQLFYLDQNYTYTGQRMMRGLMCNVFTERRSDFSLGAGGLNQAVFEYYFLADGFKVLPDDGSTSPQDVPVYLEITVPNKYHGIYNFLDFDEEHPDISLFDVSSCFSESAKLQFQIRFPGSYKTGTAGSIIRQARRVFYEKMQVAPIRVQDVRLDYDNSQIYVSATLLDRSPPDAQFTFLSGKAISMNDDLSYDATFVRNRSECARACVLNPTFTCNSYDYCPLDPLNVCKLSKAHIGDNGVSLINSTCDHFSRTVTGPLKPEPTISAAYDILTQNVYNGGVVLQIILPFQINPIYYKAVDIQVLFGWLNPKPVPSLTGQFSYHLEITVPYLKDIYDSHIYYDDKYRLVRYDMVNTQPSPPLFTVHPVTEIHDFSAGLAYMIDRQQGNCTVSPLKNASFDVTSSNDAGYVIKMKSPIDLFYLNGSYRYAGQKTIRGMLCDVFETRRHDFRFGQNPLGDSIFQFYFLSDDWQELSEDSGTPVSSQPIALVVNSVQSAFTLTYNFYDFNEQHPDLSNFDIRSCFPGSLQKHFLIKFQGDYHPTLDTNLKQFIQSVQQEISFLTRASPLRYQNPQITYTAGYTYYLGTMVEQAPTIYDFTKTSNNVGIYVADKTVDGVTSDIACANLCRNETTFTCDSFDYCKTAQKCQLSKKHQVTSGPATRLSQTCDHFSRTVDTPPRIEPTVAEAMLLLKNYVYITKDFKIPIKTAQGNTVVYKAVVFDTDILRPDTQATTSANLQHFIPSRQRVLLKNSDAQYKGVSVDQCASNCLGEVTFDCQSFDYCFDTGTCVLSQTHPDKNPKLVATPQMCDLYARSYLDGYNKYPGQVTQTQGFTTLAGISTANYCAQKCSNAQNNTCKSFDFCTGSSLCTLKHSHVLELPKTALTSSSVCSHYSRNYINDFVVSKGHDLSTGQALRFTNVSLDSCAKLCSENSGIGCKAFSYSRTTTACKLIGVNPVANRGNITSSTVTDLYTRQYYAAQSGHGGSSNPSQQGNTGTGNTGTGSSGQQQSPGSQGSTGYSGGAMAGLAIGMLIPGLVIGAALLYFCRTKKLVEEEQMRMGFVNMSHDNEDNFSQVKTHNPEEEEPPSHLHQYDTVN